MWIGGSAAVKRPTSPTVATLSGIPEGLSGAIATLHVMRRLVREAVRDPRQRIRELVLDIIGSASGTGAGFVDQVRRIQAWVQTHIRYVRDPADIELVQTPQKTLEYRAGDCDDHSVLTAALLMASGHPARFVAVGLNGRPLSHVLTQTLIGEQWQGVETITPERLGWMPAGITSHYFLKI